MESNEKKKPGRVGRVSTSELLEVLKLYIDKLPKDRKKLPGPTQPIWQLISNNHFNNRYNARDVYRQCKDNRDNIWNLLNPDDNANSSLDSAANKSYSTADDSHSQTDSGDSDDEWEAPDLDTFVIEISEEMYKKLRESEEVIYNNRSCAILTRGAWTDMIADKFYEACESRCAYIFKKGKVYKNSSCIHHVTIIGRCKSKICGNKFLGFIDYKPEGFPCILRVRTKDTSFDYLHEDVRRPVRAYKRKIIGKEASTIGSSNYLKKQATKSSRIRPNIPKIGVVRQCVNDFTSEELGLDKTDGRDIYNAIERMRDDEKYRYFIHDLKKDRFYVFYSLMDQLHAYKKYHHLMKIRKLPSVISIDGTGSIVKEITYNNGRKSGHIFLYAIVINFEGYSLSVHQLLTTDQSTNLLEWWLRQWLKMRAPKPNEVRTDYSRALINAVSLAFNCQTIKTYIDTLFLKALDHKCSEMRPMIDTYIRLDVAHFIKMIVDWNSIKTVKNPVVRNLYLSTVGLLVDAQNLETFRQIFRHLCILCLNKFDDTILGSGELVENSRTWLEKLISDRSYNFNDYSEKEEVTLNDSNDDIATNVKKDDQPRKKIQNHDTNINQINYDVNPLIVTWLTEIKDSSEKVEAIGQKTNFFYNKDFISEFMKITMKEFPIWSAACLPEKNILLGETVPEKQSHGTTSYVENYFGNKKNNVLSKYKNHVNVKKFLMIEYEDLQGSSGILKHNLITSFNKNVDINENSSDHIDVENDLSFSAEPKDDYIHIPNDDEVTNNNLSETMKGCCSLLNPDENSRDIWRNKEKIVNNDFEEPLDIGGNNKIKKETNCNKNKEITITKENKLVPESVISVASGSQSYYFRNQSDIKFRNSHLEIKQKKIKVLINGNERSPLLFNNVHYKLQNTCGFDSITQILAASASDNKSYYHYIQESSDLAMKFIETLLTAKSIVTIYRDRTTLLVTLFNSRVKPPSNPLYPHTLNLFSAASDIWTTCFKNNPSGFKTYACHQCGLHTENLYTITIRDHDVIYNNGYKYLTKYLESNVKTHESSCLHCHQPCVVECKLNQHLYVELEVRKDLESPILQCTLEEWESKHEFTINNVSYRLKGIIKHESNHFVAYCRRENGRWELYNDLEDRVTYVKSLKTKFVPSAAVFIKDESKIIDKDIKRKNDNASQSRILRSNPKKKKLVSL